MSYKRSVVAIIYATKQFRQYLLGRPFKLFTDHSLLQWLSAQKAKVMLACWALGLQEFDFSILYKSGVQNANADALSHISSSCSAVMFTTKEYQVKLQEEQKSDPLLSIVYHGVQKKKQPITSHPVIRRYLQLWSQLILCNGILCCQYFPDNSLSSVTVPVLPNTPIGHPWQMVAVDILEVPLSAANNRYLIVIQDYFTKWAEAILLPNQTACRAHYLGNH